MAQLTAPWKCTGCGNSWFRREEQERLLKARYSPNMVAARYNELGEESLRCVYICCACGVELKDLYI